MGNSNLSRLTRRINVLLAVLFFGVVIQAMNIDRENQLQIDSMQVEINSTFDELQKQTEKNESLEDELEAYKSTIYSLNIQRGRVLAELERARNQND